EESEWDHVWMTDFRMRVPEGIAGAFSSGPHQDGMSFCAHIINEEEGAIEVLLRSYDPVSMENDNEDLFYDTYIYDESGNLVGGPWARYGILEIETSPLPAGHYDVVWRYYNDDDGSEMLVNGSNNKIIYISLDSANIDLDNIGYTKVGNYPVNISFNWDQSRDIYIRGYTTSIDDRGDDNSHLSNINMCNGSVINTTILENAFLYSNYGFGYYLGDNCETNNIVLDLSLKSINNDSLNSYVTWYFRISDNGWKDPKINDMNNNEIPDYYEFYDRKKLRPLGVFIKYNTNTKTKEYEGWNKWENYYYASDYCVIRAGDSFSIFSNNWDIKPSFDWDNSIDTSWLTITFEKKEWDSFTGKTIKWYKLFIDASAPICFFNLNFGREFIFGNLKGFITVYRITIYIVLNIPQSTSWSCNEDDITKLTDKGVNTYLYQEDTSFKRFLHTVIYNYQYLPNLNNWYENIYRLEPMTKYIYDMAIKVCYGSTNYLSVVCSLSKFIPKIMNYDINNPNGYYDVQKMLKNPFRPIGSTTDSINDDDIIQIMKQGKDRSFRIAGQCLDYSAIVCSFTRAVGVPSRTIFGLYPWIWSYHVWIEFWDDDESKWMVIDLTEQEPNLFEGITTREKYIFGYNPNIRPGNPNPRTSEGIYFPSSSWIIGQFQQSRSYIRGTNNNQFDEGPDMIFSDEEDIIYILQYYE
ncbi:MAG: transglutaminase domain-containing protein, partial [Thermoplasmata archaeon]